MFRGQYETALTLLQEALALDPNNARTRAALAFTYLRLGDANAGLAEAERAVELAPAMGVYYTSRGECRAALGEVEGAVADFETALRLEPANYRIYYNYACFWAGRGDENQCRRYLERTLTLCPPFFPPLVLRDPALARVRDAAWFAEVIRAGTREKRNGVDYPGGTTSN